MAAAVLIILGAALIVLTLADLLSATLIATAAPVVVCPAMHTEMWEHPAVVDNIRVLRERGVVIVPPEEGRLAGGDIGKGRLAEPATVVDAVLAVVPSVLVDPVGELGGGDIERGFEKDSEPGPACVGHR